MNIIKTIKICLKKSEKKKKKSKSDITLASYMLKLFFITASEVMYLQL